MPIREIPVLVAIKKITDEIKKKVERKYVKEIGSCYLFPSTEATFERMDKEWEGKEKKMKRVNLT